jgi:hypothetical protein
MLRPLQRYSLKLGNQVLLAGVKGLRPHAPGHQQNYAESEQEKLSSDVISWKISNRASRCVKADCTAAGFHRETEMATIA